MRRALELARRYRGYTSPNPCVGAVIVRDGRIVGEGAHVSAGKPHAEAVALSNAGERARGATLYCTLEPCNHYGKTPPCTEAIIAAGVSQVVFAVEDPNPDVAGKGAERLREAGVEVTCSILEDEGHHLNREFFHFCRTSRPWVVLKMATSLDGKVATASGESQWITSRESREHAHRLRHEVDAVVVGAGTLTADNPRLTVRIPGGPWKQPWRIVLDSTGRSTPEAALFDSSIASPSMLATTSSAPVTAIASFESRGVDVLVAENDPLGRVDLSSFLQLLGQRGIQSLLVEGGPRVAGSFLESDLVDEVVSYLSPSLIGGDDAKSALAGPGRPALSERLWLDRLTVDRAGNDIVVRGMVRRPSHSSG